MVKVFKKQPFYLLLIPLFFVLHGFAENFGFISFGDVLILAATYIATAIITYLIFFLIFKSSVKAALTASLMIGFYLFFGAIQDFVKAHIAGLNKYSLLLLIFGIILIALFIYLKRTNNKFPRLNLFLNSLLLIYVIIDIGTLFYKGFNVPGNRLSVYSFTKNNNYINCADCLKPDIYFLLFDEYASSVSLKNHFNFDNSALDTFLLQQQFHIQKNSTTNYNFTPFSMASILNMSYLQGITPDSISIEDYARCNNLIKENMVIDFLSTQGYGIINYSIFDLAGHPSTVHQDFLPLQTKLITDGTLLNRMQKDIGWMLLTGKHKWQWLADKMYYSNMHNNETFLNEIEKSSSLNTGKPSFFYAHFFMPHPPFYFDKKGVLKDGATIYKEAEELNIAAYLEYVDYTNTKIGKLIAAIKRNTMGKAVIILMGDHGFRKFTADGDTTHFFQNQNAVYFPSGDYHLLYDSISAVNQFGAVFNTLFHQNFPILNDSTVFLTDKK